MIILPYYSISKVNEYVCFVKKTPHRENIETAFGMLHEIYRLKKHGYNHDRYDVANQEIPNSSTLGSVLILQSLEK